MIRDAEHSSQMLIVKGGDREMKEEGWIYADRKSTAKDFGLEPGNKIYIKNMNRENELTVNHSRTYAVDKV